MRLGQQITALFLSSALAAGLGACHGRPDQAADAPMFSDAGGQISIPANSPLRSHIAVQPVGAASGEAGVDLPASVEADPARVANVLAPLTGRVLSLKAALGQRVTKGQVLAVIASGDYAQAQDDARKADDALDLARKALARTKGVQQAGGAASKDIEAAQSAYNQAEDEAMRAHSRLAALNGAGGGHARNLTLTAPQSGVITALAVAQGAQVNDPTATLMTVTNTDRVFVTADVAEDDLSKIRVGQDARITLAASPDAPITAKIADLDAIIGTDTRRRKARIPLANGDGRLLPGMYATVRVFTPSSGSVFVPQSALLMNNDAITVLVETRPWVFHRQPVRIGDETATSVQVLAGLKPGDRVIVRGGVLLDD